jgi:hypothetical protein
MPDIEGNHIFPNRHPSDPIALLAGRASTERPSETTSELLRKSPRLLLAFSAQHRAQERLRRDRARNAASVVHGAPIPEHEALLA